MMRIVAIPGVFYLRAEAEYDRHFEQARRLGQDTWNADEYATNKVNEFFRAHVNEVPEVYCHDCEDYGYIEIFDHSTDGLIGQRTCPRLHGRVYKWNLFPEKFGITIDILEPPF